MEATRNGCQVAFIEVRGWQPRDTNVTGASSLHMGET